MPLRGRRKSSHFFNFKLAANNFSLFFFYFFIFILYIPYVLLTRFQCIFYFCKSVLLIFYFEKIKQKRETKILANDLSRSTSICSLRKKTRLISLVRSS
jgi:hypothetical protein